MPIPNSKFKFRRLNLFAYKAMDWIGSVTSLIVHTLVFIFSFSLIMFGVPADKVLLVVTTLVSLEAIYMAIFIQMAVNKNTQSLEEVEEDIDEIQKDVDDIQEDVGEIEKDIDEIQEDVDDIEKDDDQHLVHGQKTQDVLVRIQGELEKLMKEIDEIKKEKELK